MNLLNKDKDSLNTLITGAGLSATVLVAFIFYFWSAGLATPRVIGFIAAFGCVLQLSIWFAFKYFQHPGKALFSVLLIFIVLSFVPFAFYLALAFGFVTGWLFLREYASNFRREIFPSSISPVLGALLALVIFSATSQNLGDVFAEEKVRQLAMNPDTLFHASISTMLKNYVEVATGLDGFSRVHYHVMSHFLYACVSRALGVDVISVYGLATFLVFAPLLVTSLMRAVGMIAVDSKISFWIVALSVLGGPLSLCFSTQDHSHFISESYLLGLILFYGGLTFVCSFVFQETIGFRNFLWSLAFLVAVTTAKISLGVSIGMTLGIAVFFSRNTKIQNKAWMFLGLVVFGWIGYHFARTIPIPGLEVKYEWDFYHTHVEKSLGTTSFYLKMFPYFFLTLFFAIISFLGKSFDGKKATLLLMLLAVSLLGFAALHLTIDSSGYYFSNIHAFLALPILVALGFRDQGTNLLATRMLSIGLVLFFSLSAGFFFWKIFPQQYKEIKDIRSIVIGHAGYQNPYWESFKTIAKDPDKKMMVYVPKTETRFWWNADGAWSPWFGYQPINMPFYIPIPTGKPAIFGLPDHGRTFHRGYESYSSTDFAASAKSNYSDQELCDEVKKKGFHGFYRVGTNGLTRHLCH